MIPLEEELRKQRDYFFAVAGAFIALAQRDLPKGNGHSRNMTDLAGAYIRSCKWVDRDWLTMPEESPEWPDTIRHEVEEYLVKYPIA